MTIGKRLKELRLAKSLTQDGLGELFRTEEKPEGLSKQAIAAWEAERNQLTADQIMFLCKLYGVSADYLLFGTEDEEIELLTNYRAASARAKIAIRMAAKTSERG